LNSGFSPDQIAVLPNYHSNYLVNIPWVSKPFGYIRPIKLKFPAMKKFNFNWWRVAFFLLTVGMVVLESCSLFKPKCNCPHW
jgi:hypothetical protein